MYSQLPLRYLEHPVDVEVTPSCYQDKWVHSRALEKLLLVVYTTAVSLGILSRNIYYVDMAEVQFSPSRGNHSPPGASLM